MFEFIHNPLSAWIILGVSICLTIFAYIISENFIEDRKRTEFEAQTTNILKAIESRMLVYEQVLWSSVGLMHASNSVTREEWHIFVNTLKIAENWPGIQGLGYAIPIKANELENHIKQVREEGFPEYQVYPAGTRALYTPVIYIEPQDWRNIRAFGYDGWTNDLRRKTMIRARDQGMAATSGIITLVQETAQDLQRGFLTYVPVYESSQPLETTQQRREAFKGWVYGAFRVKDLMRGILGTNRLDIKFDIYDGEYLSENQLLFQSDTTSPLPSQTTQPKTVFESLLRLPLQGRIWTIHFYKPISSNDHPEDELPTIIVIAGIIIDLLLFYVIISLHVIHRTTDRRIRDKTVGLENQINELNKQISQQTKEIEQLKNTLSSESEESKKREMRLIQLKQEVNELLKQLELPNRYDSYS